MIVVYSFTRAEQRFTYYNYPLHSNASIKSNHNFSARQCTDAPILATQPCGFGYDVLFHRHLEISPRPVLAPIGCYYWYRIAFKMVNHLKKQQKSKEASKKIADVPVVLFISSNVEDRGRSPMKKLETFHCTLGDRFGRDREFYSTTKDEDGMTPLHYAARLLPTGSISWVEHEEERQKWNLLLKGFNQDDLNVQDEDGRTPLSHAAEVGSAWVVDKLIKTGADLYQCDQNGRSPLSWAAQSGERESMEILSWNAGVFDDKDNRGWTPCHYFLQREPESAEDTISGFFHLSGTEAIPKRSDTLPGARCSRVLACRREWQPTISVRPCYLRLLLVASLCCRVLSSLIEF
jgi:hypothetical protein